MAYVYSTAQTTSSYGNVSMTVNIFRGDVTRTEKGISFDFGVSFKPNATTTNSIAAWYGSTQKYAYANHGLNYSDQSVKAKSGTTYYARYTGAGYAGSYDSDKTHANTSQVTCFNYSTNGANKDTTEISITIGVGWNNHAGSNKGDMTFKISVPKYIGSGTAPSAITVTEVHDDEGVNKVTFSGTLGKKGANNALSSATLYYTTNGTAPTNKSYSGYFNLGSTSGGSYSKEVTFSSSCTFKAIVYCTFEYNTTNSGAASKAVKYCTAPSFSKAPVLTYTKSRLTVKEPWTFSWTGVNGTNCPIVSYRLRLFKGKASNNLSQIAIKNSAGNVISDPTHKTYDTGNTNTSFVLDPIVNGFEPGDIVKLSIFAQGKTANTDNLWWSGNGTTHTFSAEYLVQNAGVMRPLVNGKHVEGVVLVALPDNNDKGYTWTEADVVKVYTPNKTWAEAE